jgi:hypothetical protein
MPLGGQSPLPFAEDVSFWKTSQSSPDTWMSRTKTLIEKRGGSIVREAFGREGETSAYMIEFSLDGELFRVVWPVLPTRTKSASDRDARRQAVTLIYHDVKARLNTALVKGARAAFFSYLVLPDGRTAAEASVSTLMDGIPPMIALPPKAGSGHEGSE